MTALQEHNVQPELKHVVPVVHLYAAAGQYDQARKLISDISREHAAVLNIAVYNAFLKVSCRSLSAAISADNASPVQRDTDLPLLASFIDNAAYLQGS